MLTTPQRIVFVDTETTDIEPNRAVPWEIALVIRDPGMLDVEEVHLIHIDALRADPDALTVSRYYDRHPCAAALKVVADDAHGRVEAGGESAALFAGCA